MDDGSDASRLADQYDELAHRLRAVYKLAQTMNDVHIAVAVTGEDVESAGYVLSAAGDRIDPMFRAIAVLTARWLKSDDVAKSVNATLLNAIWASATDGEDDAAS